MTTPTSTSKTPNSLERSQLLLDPPFYLDRNYKWGPNSTQRAWLVHPKLCNINSHKVTHSLISRNCRERRFVVQISLLVVTFLSLITWILSLIQTTKEVNLHPRIVPYVNMWNVIFFFFFILCHLLNVVICICHIAGNAKWSRPHHTIKML